MAIGLTYGTNAGYAINPARDLGPQLWTWIEGWGPLAFLGAGTYFDNYWWVPIVGPLVGGAVGIVIYDALIGTSLPARASGATRSPRTRRVGVLGTAFTTGSALIATWLGADDIEAEAPASEDAERLDTIIFGELVNGTASEASRRWCVEIVRGLAERGCDAVALASTELPLLRAPEDSPCPSSTRPARSPTTRSTWPWPALRCPRGTRGSTLRSAGDPHIDPGESRRPVRWGAGLAANGGRTAPSMGILQHATPA